MRRFAFFEKDVTRVSALSCLDVTCATSGGGVLSLGDSEGHIILVSRDLSLTAFAAHAHRVNAIAHVRGTDVLLTIGDGADSRPASARAAAQATVLSVRERERREVDARADAPPEGTDLATALGVSRLNFEGAASALASAGGGSTWDVGAVLGSAGAPAAVLKVWRLDRRDPTTGEPECMRTVRVFEPAGAGGGVGGGGGGGGSGGGVGARGVALASDSERVVTALAASDDGSQVAIGCGDGTLLLLRSDFLREGAAREGRLFGFGGMGASAGVRTQVLREADGAATGGGDFAAGVGIGAITSLVFSLAPDPNASSALRSPPRGGALLGSGRNARARGMLTLFCATHSRVRSYFTTDVRPVGMGRGWTSSECCIELAGSDDAWAGAGPGRTAVTDSGDFAVARDGGVSYSNLCERRPQHCITPPHPAPPPSTLPIYKKNS